MYPYDTVIFDLDGTLLNTLQDLADSTNYALALQGMPARTLEEVRRFVGNGVGRLIHRAVPEGTPEEVEARVLADFRAHYTLNMEHKTAPYPGVLPLLDRLGQAGIRTAVVSNKFDSAVKGLCHAYFGGAVAVSGTEQGETPESLVTPAFVGFPPVVENGIKAALTTGMTTDRKNFIFTARRGIMTEK